MVHEVPASALQQQHQELAIIIIHIVLAVEYCASIHLHITYNQHYIHLTPAKKKAKKAVFTRKIFVFLTERTLRFRKFSGVLALRARVPNLYYNTQKPSILHPILFVTEGISDRAGDPNWEVDERPHMLHFDIILVVSSSQPHEPSG